MASIDKTYTTKYSEYKEFKEWARDKAVPFFDGKFFKVKEVIYDRDEEDFDGRDLPVFNSAEWLDIYLIKYCPVKFVQNRLLEVYNSKFIEYAKEQEFPLRPPKGFEKNRRISIRNSKETKFPFHTKPYPHWNAKNQKITNTWWVRCENNWLFNYNSKSKVWAEGQEYYNVNTCVAHFGSLKAVVRNLRKQYLPKGLVFTISGRYAAEKYLAVVC
jgi:hypothetical protein